MHSAADSEYGNAFYGEMLGGRFARHPAVQSAMIRVEDPSHPSTKALPSTWTRVDEWYDFEPSPRGRVHVLLNLDQASYAGAAMNADHPIAWCIEVGLGRAWYTALGHTSESYAEPLFLEHLRGGLRSVTGLDNADCTSRNGAGGGIALESSSARSLSSQIEIASPVAQKYRFSGSFMPRYTEIYTFSVSGDGNAAVTIAGESLYNSVVTATTPATFSAALVAGRRYPIVVEYDAQSSASFALRWKSERQPEEIISAPQLYTPRGRPLH